MDEHFELFEKGIRLSSVQRDDVATKFKGVGNSLYKEFYGEGEDKTKRLKIGSHGKKTELRSEDGDIDMIFKISADTLDRYKKHSSNGPAELLRRAKERLKETYSNSSTQHKTWGKVVLVEFVTGYNVEVMPCFEESDGTFTIPNSEDSGSWDKYDPRAEIDNIKQSNDKTGITRKFIRMAKHWNNQTGETIKSYVIENLCVAFLDNSYDDQSWSELFESFFSWLPFQADSELSEDSISRITTARGRIDKARAAELSDDFEQACQDWRNVFRSEYPLYDEDLIQVLALEKAFPSSEEEWIEDRYPVKIDSSLKLSIQTKVLPKGFRSYIPLNDALAFLGGLLTKSAKMEFNAVIDSASTYNFRWKVRNLSLEAKNNNKLRGNIEPPSSNQSTYSDSTAFQGTHYIECYAIKDGVCVAKARRFVKIGEK